MRVFETNILSSGPDRLAVVGSVVTVLLAEHAMQVLSKGLAVLLKPGSSLEGAESGTVVQARLRKREASVTARARGSTWTTLAALDD